MKMKFSLRRIRQQLKAIVRPMYFAIILVLSGFIISQLCLMINKTKHGVIMESYDVRNKSFKEIDMAAKQLQRLNSSAINLARALSLYLNGTQLSFFAIETKVAPTLFLALATIPQLSQISFIGLDGLLFSFYHEKDKTFAVYSNNSFSPNLFTKPVNRDTGKSYGDAIVTQSMMTVNASWFQEALNSTWGYSSLGTGWNKAEKNLFLNNVALHGRGVISLGYPIQVVVDHFAALDFHGGYFHLSTADGQMIVQTSLPNSRIEIYNSTVNVRMLKPNGDLLSSDTFSCRSDNGGLKSIHHGKTVGGKHTFYCSAIDIAGVQSVYVLAYPRNKLVELVNRNSKISIMLVVLIFVFVIVSLCIYIFLTARATNREMFLCAALIKQTEATQQAERKSMNKTKAYAVANHDVRASLAAITGLIELCHDGANPDSELAANLVQMEKCTRDLLDILNSILDMSKIEAGKTSLEKEDFNLAQLLEDVVNMFYPLGMKKAYPVDIVLDPCDGSILRSPLVRGDRVKLKQILCNLLNNAIKFTSEGGHVCVRAVIKKNNFKKEIIASNRTTMWKFLSKFCYKKNEDGFNDLDALHTVEENPDEMEFEFEVDDTGKGIPKDKQKSIFEDYVQVKETAIGQEGCGLGLGIVQSLVRVMKGELRIVEKEPGERGTCFKFNVFLSACEPESIGAEEDRPSNALNQHFPFMSPKPEGSLVILFIAGHERRKVLKKFIESLNIKVSIINHGRNFRVELEKIKRKLDLSSINSGKPDSSSVEYLSKSASTDSDHGPYDGSPSIKDGNDHITPHYKKTNSKSSSAFVLLVIDAANASRDSDFHSILSNFRKDIPKSFYKVVWLEDQTMHHPKDQAQDKLAIGGDYIISKPFHGSRLMQVLSLLPERKGASQLYFSKSTMGQITQEDQHSVEPQFSNEFSYSGIELPESSKLQRIIVHKHDEKGRDKPLNGKKVLLVEDVPLLRKVITTSLQKLGAHIEVCTNGKEAFNQVCKALSDQKKEGCSKAAPYDFIFMDCEMPVMNGYEATRMIRIEEQHYGVHIPIIALTAHAMTEEASKSIDAGMDFHLTKPLQVDKLLDILRSIDNQ